jgi:hypothetical protein
MSLTARHSSLLACEIFRFLRLGQFDAKSRSLQSFVFRYEVFSCTTNEARCRTALFDENFITGTGLGLSVLITLFAQQGPAKLSVSDARVHVVGLLRQFGRASRQRFPIR